MKTSLSSSRDAGNKQSREENLNYYRHLNIPGGDLRVSITAECNMRCTYCHNEGQGDFRADFMSLETLKSIVKMGLRHGINKVRLTGGEPLMHPQVFEMIKMLKSELIMRNVGVNTNGVTLTPQRIQKLIDAGLDVAVVGLDYFNADVSKDSPSGKSSDKILGHILTAKKMGLNTQIATVYSNSDPLNIIRMAEWCNDNNILLKVLEVSNDSIVSTTSAEFLQIIELMRMTFGLRLGKTVSLNETYGVHGSGNKVLFFHSHCRTRECHECSQMHMRVTTKGNAKPCILRTDTEYSLVSGDVDHAMRRAIHNLGNPPENPPK
ncbi:MAG: putative molybdenum cofactor biosynthesis protein A [Candidatus Giovannonibacteria bacterium GW2011_GWA2_44_26]|uniref:Putative molybdenum cofactor biosynthesis protein A n=1 Tax=Candidatus Giovannonibacteria bacterium GW2011_GWA2_44_26 TaxID=1618648 RepID=A0A0G1IQS8_9BACT|nr:MAG: putative molybdenum cofactor biosynthesis protein A [Candidatus Giovannonibacteria bacterium GW2011_GWA2_44_26]